MRIVGPWTLCEDGAGAYRALLDTDGEVITNRVAFIEKTPRIRIRREDQYTEDYLNWASGPFKGYGPLDDASRAWCDEALALFGYRVKDPVVYGWRDVL